jgi:PAS domain S-box-containing protein
MPENKYITATSVPVAVQEIPIYGIILLDLEGIVQSWNLGATHLLGYSAEEALGRHFEFFFTPEDRAKGAPQAEMEGARSTGCGYDDRWQLRKNQTRVYVHGALSLIKNEKSESVGYIKILRDETEKAERLERIENLNQRLREAHESLRGHAEKLEERVAERTRELNERNAELEAFCYSVAHDIRAPLRSIQSMSEVVIEDYGATLDPTCRDYLDRIARAGSRLDRLTLDLLRYSRMAREEVTLTQVSLENALREALSLLHETIEGKGADVQVEGPLPEVHAQSGYLLQILINLLTNALKFVRPEIKPVIKIWTEAGKDHVRLFVQDNGIGIPSEYREKIFHLFERLHPDGTFEGTGVGLAIAQKAASRIHATIGLTADAGPGSTFWIDLETAK